MYCKVHHCYSGEEFEPKMNNETPRRRNYWSGRKIVFFLFFINGRKNHNLKSKNHKIRIYSLSCLDYRYFDTKNT